MIRGRKKAIGALAAVMAVALAAGVALGFPARQTANAERTSAWVTVEEIYNDDASRFKASELRKLYQALAGSDVKTLTALESAMDAKSGTLTSADFRTAGGGSNNVSVTFGGMKWDAVYLTEATDGDIILDLWRSADELTSGDIAVYSGWATNAIYTYSSNMYSTSRIRVETLNAGGKYSTSGSALTEHGQTESNQYARFTMSEADKSLTQYLAKPSEVGYQAKEWDEATAASVNSGKYYFPNDTYEEPQGGQWYSDNYNYLADDRDTGREDGAKYGSWKDDYLWLPSLTEVGTEDGNGNGIWDTDTSLRSAIRESYNFYWLRSGAHDRPDYAYVVYDYAGCASQSVHNSAKVRPALHLNLTAAARTALPMKDDWKDDSKPYDPDGVKWTLENTENVTITPVEQDGGDTNWWNEDDKSITATKVGKYQIQVKPNADYKWEEDDTDETITATYTVTPVDMTLTFNGTHLAKRRDIVYESNMDAIELKLPEPTESTFPISWEGVTWDEGTASKISIQYIVHKHDEAEHDDDEIESYLNELRSGQHEEGWKDYNDLEDKTALLPMGYTVYFKAVDTEGNHNQLIDYFGVHIANEALSITLKAEAREAFTKGVEYGDVSHNKTLFEEQIVGGIEKITAPNADPSLPEIDRTEDFKTNIDNFTFYLRKDNTIGPEGTVNDDGDVYTIEDDGVHLHKSGSQKVDYLPLGTYHLYVAYTEPPKDAEDASDYITFTWVKGRPSFEVMARKITVTLTFADKIYGQDPEGWVTASAARTNGVEGNWYAPMDAPTDGDGFNIFARSYSLQGTKGGAPLTSPTHPGKTTPADTYTVTPTWTNENYEVTFAYPSGQSYTVKQREITETITWTNAEGHVYNGSAVSPSASVTVDGNVVRLVVTIAGDTPENTTFRNVDHYTFTADLSEADKQNYKFADGVVLTKTAEITPAKLTLEWGEKSFTYTGAVIGPDEYPTVTVNGRVASEGSDEVDVTIAPDQEFKNAGSYTFTATLKGTEAGNYVIDDGNGTHDYTIGKATITVSGTYTDSKTYDGSVYSETVKAAEKSLNVEMSVTDPTFEIAIKTGGKDANTYAESITEDDVTYDETNFELKLEGAGYSITIGKKVLDAGSIEWGTLTFEYSGSEQKPAPKIATGVEDDADIVLTVTVAGSPIDADDYNATAALPDTASNYTLSGDSTKEFTITPQKVTVNWSDLRLPYSGAAQQPKAEATDKQEHPVTLAVTVTEPEHSAVGQYHATATTEDHNYELEGATTTFDIVACEIELTAEEKSVIEGYITKIKEYNGDAVAAVSAEQDYLERLEGALQVKFTLSANYNEKNVNAANSITVKMTLTDATAFSFVASTQGVEYSVEGGAAISWSIDEGVSITAKSLEVRFDGLTKTYAATELSPTATAETGVGSETVTLTVTLANGTASLTEGKAINAGTYSATAEITGTSEGTEAGNYSLTGATQTFTIERASVAVEWSGTEGHVYSGTAFEMPKATAKGVGDDELTLTVDFDDTSSMRDAFKSAGDYVFKATIEGDLAGNYTLTNDKTDTITITKKPVEAPTSFDPKTYNGEAQTVDLGEDKDYKLKEGTGKGTNAGKYDVTLELNDTANYMWSDTEGSNERTLSQAFEIEKAKIAGEIEWGGVLDSYPYNGSAYETPTATAKGIGSATLTLTVTMKSHGGIEGSADFKDAEVYIFEAGLSEDDQTNYEFEEGIVLTKEIEISPITVTVTWEEKSYTYNGTDLAFPTATANGVESDGALTLTVTVSEYAGTDKHFKNAGAYTFQAALDESDAKSKNYRLDEETDRQEYTVAKANMSAAFNGDHMLKSSTHVYRSDMDPIRLKLPDPTDSQFPIAWANASWEGAHITVYYIITTHDEGIHSGDTDAAIAAYLQTLKEGEDSELWKEYDPESEEMNVTAPMGYCVYFKIVDEDGNHNDYYDYFSVHIAHEELSITLTDAARQGFTEGVEYGDFARTKEHFEQNIVNGIDTIKSAGDTSVDKETFVKNIDNFTFYLRKDNAETGDIYTVLDDGIHLYKDGSSRVTNLPIGTYWIYVTYNGDVGGGEVKHVEFTWERGRPSFTVSPRKVTVELVFESHVYGDDFTDWVTVGDRSRTTEGMTNENWYAPGEQNVDLGLTYSLENVGTPTATTNAGTYQVITGYRADNYEVTFVNASGEELSYTIEKATLTVTANDQTITYGEEPTDGGVTYDGFVNDESEDDLGGELKYAFNYVQYDDIGEDYTITPSGYTSDNYDIHYVEGTLKVNAKSVTVTITVPEDLTYGNVGEFTVKVEGLVNDDAVTAILEYSGTPNDKTPFTAGATKPALAGSYSVKVTGLNGEKAGNYTFALDGKEDFTIERASVTKPTADTNPYTYNGEEQTYTVVGGDSEYFRVDGNVKKDANESGYTVTVSLNDKDNYKWADTEEDTDDLTFLFVIKKAALTVTANDKTIIYGAEPSDSGVTYEGFVNNESEEALGGELKYAFNYGQYDGVGTYTITPSGYTSDNYDIHYVAGTLTVEAKEIEVKWSERSYTYTGSELELPAATAEGVGEDGTFALSVALNDPSQTFMNAGSYVFRAMLDSSDPKAKNYTLKPDTATHSYTVEKQTVTAPAIGSKVYNGAVQRADVAPSELYTVTENNGGTDVDSYDVKLTLQHPENYKWAESETEEIVLTFTITKADYDMSGVTFEDLTLDYDGQEHGITIEGTLPNGVSVTYEGNGKKEVGEYTVTAVFKGDERNYNPIPSKEATLKILAISHDLSGIEFNDVTVKYDGNAHSIYIEGTLPHGVTVTYENNRQTDPNVYTITAVFGDHVGEFERKTAQLTILRTHTQSEPGEGSGAEVALDSEEGFDPTLELVVERTESATRSYLAWEKDTLSEKYTVKMCKNGEEVPIDGKVTVRLLIPEAFRDKDFELVAVARAASIEYTREGDYVVFESDGLSAYVFTSSYTPYFPIIIAASCVLLADIAAMIVLAVVMKKKRSRR